MEELQQQLEVEKQRNAELDATLRQSAEAGQFLLSGNQTLQQELENARQDLDFLKSSVETERKDMQKQLQQSRASTVFDSSQCDGHEDCLGSSANDKMQSKPSHVGSSKVDDHLEERLEEVMEDNKALTEECRRLQVMANELRDQEQVLVAQVDDLTRRNAGSPWHDDHAGAQSEKSPGIHEQVHAGVHLKGAMRNVLHDVKEHREQEYASLKEENKALKSRVEELETQHKADSERMGEISEDLDIAESKVEELEDSERHLTELVEQDKHTIAELRGHNDLLQEDIQDKSEKMSAHEQSMKRSGSEGGIEPFLSCQLEHAVSDEEDDDKQPAREDQLRAEMEAEKQRVDSFRMECSEFRASREEALARLEAAERDLKARELARSQDGDTKLTGLQSLLSEECVQLSLMRIAQDASQSNLLEESRQVSKTSAARDEAVELVAEAKRDALVDKEALHARLEIVEREASTREASMVVEHDESRAGLEARLQLHGRHWGESEELCGRYEHELARFELARSHAETLAEVHAEGLAQLRDEHSSKTLQLQSSEMELREHQREKMLRYEQHSDGREEAAAQGAGLRAQLTVLQAQYQEYRTRHDDMLLKFGNAEMKAHVLTQTLAECEESHEGHRERMCEKYQRSKEERKMLRIAVKDASHRAKLAAAQDQPLEEEEEEEPSFWERWTGGLACGGRTVNKPVQSTTARATNATGEPFSEPEPRMVSLALANRGETGFPDNLRGCYERSSSSAGAVARPSFRKQKLPKKGGSRRERSSSSSSVASLDSVSERIAASARSQALGPSPTPPAPTWRLVVQSTQGGGEAPPLNQSQGFVQL